MGGIYLFKIKKEDGKFSLPGIFLPQERKKKYGDCDLETPS